MTYATGIILFLCIVQYVQFTNGVLSKEMMKKLKEGKTATVDLEELKQVFDEDTFSKILQWIDKNSICLRHGEKAEDQAAYAMSEKTTSKVIEEWIKNPYTKHQVNSKQWYDKLYNSVSLSFENEKDMEAPMLLGKGGFPRDETYTAKYPIGNGKTFPKAIIEKQVGELFILKKPAEMSDLKEPVRKVLQVIKDTCLTDLKKDRKKSFIAPY